MINDRGHKKWTSLMLPEHKELLRDWAHHQEDIEMPVLDADRIDELNNIISHCLNQGISTKITYFKNKRMAFINGEILKCDPFEKVLKVSTDSGRSVISLSSIIDISY